MSSIITLADFSIAARPLGYKVYGQEYDKLPKFYEEVAKVSKMRGYMDEDIRIGDLGRMQRRGEGEAFITDKYSQQYVTRYIAVDYALGAAITKRAIEQAKGFDLMGSISRSLANASVQERNHKIAEIFNNAFDAAAQPMADGAALCTTAGVNSSGLSSSNKLSVDADFSEAALETLLIQISSAARNDRGELIPLEARKLVIHPSFQYEVERILSSTLRAGTMDNDKNVHMGMFSNGKVKMSPLLSDADAWFILTNVNDGDYGIQVKENRPFELDTDVDFKTSSVLIKAETSFCVGVTDRLCIYGSQGA